MHIPDIKLAQVVDRFDQITARMSATSDSDEIVYGCARGNGGPRGHAG